MQTTSLEYCSGTQLSWNVSDKCYHHYPIGFFPRGIINWGQSLQIQALNSCLSLRSPSWPMSLKHVEKLRKSQESFSPLWLKLGRILSWAICSRILSPVSTQARRILPDLPSPVFCNVRRDAPVEEQENCLLVPYSFHQWKVWSNIFIGGTFVTSILHVSILTYPPLIFLNV